MGSVLTQPLLLWLLETLPEATIRVFVIPHSHLDVSWLHTVQIGAWGHPPALPPLKLYLPSPFQILCWVCSLGST